jgi:hypothetical protein
VLRNSYLIIDRQEIYHLGASLKDLGKRWFAFSTVQVRVRTNRLSSPADSADPVRAY